MINKDVTLLLKKADELRALFVLGQRVIPFLEEIFIFVSEIQPLLDEINNSIHENLKKMPNASQQLSKVTEATEMATTEIMDIVDGLVYKSDIISANLNRIVEIDAKKRENPIKLLELLHRAIQQKSDLTMILPQLAAAIQNMKNMPGKEYNKIINDTTEIVQSISMDSSSIMMSLQVQDITSQQIAAVNNLLETVQGKLSRILEHFQSSDISDIVSGDELPLNHIKVSKLHREIAFDPDAIDSITNKASRQGEVDDFMKNHNSGLNTEASQDDIDALFSGMGDDIEEEPIEEPIKTPSVTTIVNNAPTSAPVSDDPFEQFSQDDIDALFGN